MTDTVANRHDARGSAPPRRARMSRRSNAATSAAKAALVCLALLGADARPADAATVRWWTVRADRSASTTVTLTKPVVLLLGEPGDKHSVGISGGGAAAGLLVTPVHGGDSIGQIAVDGQRYSLGPERIAVPTGTYVLRVVASAPVVVRIPVLGAAATWRASRALRVERRAATWDVAAGPVLLGGAAVTLRPGSTALLALHYTATRSTSEDVVCLTEPNGLCLAGEGTWAASAYTTSHPPEAMTPGDFAVYAEHVEPGRFTARWRVTTVGAATAPAAFALVVG